MNRARLPEVVVETRIIAVLRGLDPDRVDSVAGILRGAGIGAIEVTMDSPQASRSIERLAQSGPGVGAGTVMSVTEAEAAVAAGASFLVAPHTDPTVVRWAVERGIPMIPGAFTPTEVMAAWNAGVAAVKVFPASVAGPDLVKALQGPSRGSRSFRPAASLLRTRRPFSALGPWQSGWVAGSPVTPTSR